MTPSTLTDEADADDAGDPTTSRRRALTAGTGALVALAGRSALRRGTAAGTPAPAPEPLGGPWPTDGADPARTNAAPDASLPGDDARPARVLGASSPAAGGVRDGPVVAGGTAFAAARTGHLLARGRHEWTADL